MVAIVGHNGLGGQYKTVHYAGSMQQWEALAIFPYNNTLVGGPINAAKDDSQVLYSGNIESTSLSWTLTADGILTIEGTGTMSDWTETYVAPWEQYASDIKSLVISEDVTYIGSYAFDGLTNVQSVKIGASVTKLGNYAFCGCDQMLAVAIDENSSMEEIGSYCFDDCSNLRYINIPDSVTTLGTAAFQTCTMLDHAIQNPTTGEYVYPPQGRCWSLGQDQMLEAMNQWCEYKLLDLHDNEKRAEMCGVSTCIAADLV